MKRTINLIALIGVAFVLLIAMQAKTNAQQLLLNEVEIDPPSTVSNACQYAEVRGTPGAAVPANTYFLSVNSDGANFGFVNQAVNFGGQTVGANGTITLYNTSSGNCPNRTFPAGTTVVNYFTPLTIGTGSETYLIVQSTAQILNGADLDANDDGIFDAAFGITVLDGFALIVNPEEEYVYGAAAGVRNISNTISLDQPDAVSRFANNTTPFSQSAFYFGELAETPDETTAYAAPLSPNFPAGGALTPGAPNVGAAAGNKARADFDGDGRTDLSVFRPTDSNWYLSRSTAGFTAVQFGAATDIPTPGDFDGDGRTDIAVFRPSSGTWFILNSSNGQFVATQFGASGDVPQPGDFDGDGRDDLAVFRPSVGTWYRLNSSNGQFVAVQFGASGDIPVGGDYDGDGRDDLAVFRPSVTNWFILNSSNGQFTATQFGAATDLLVPADYDGDNREDIAVFRPSTGTWFRLNSSNGQFVAVQFGANGDVPVPGDYDGDGRDDQAVYRGGTWFQNRSTGGFAAANFGAANDLPIPKQYIP